MEEIQRHACAWVCRRCLELGASRWDFCARIGRGGMRAADAAENVRQPAYAALGGCRHRRWLLWPLRGCFRQPGAGGQWY